MEQRCENCLYEYHDDNQEPCSFCITSEKHDGYSMSHFTPKKDLNQVLREKLGKDNGRILHDPFLDEQPEDVIKKPSHYMLGTSGLEVRGVLELLVGKIHEADTHPNEALFISDYVQMMQYLMRFMDKNGKQDLEKARWYLDKLIEAYE